MGSNHRKNKGHNHHPHRNNNNQGGSAVGTTTPASPVSSTSSSGGHHHPKNHPRRNNGGRAASSSMLPAVLQTVSSAGSSSTATTTKAADPTTDAAFWMAEVLEEEEEEMEKNKPSTIFRLSCREILVVGLVLLALLGVSMFLGIAAGISVSVQFYDTEGTGLSSGGGGSSVGLEDGFLPHRVTISEPSIALGGSMPARTKQTLAGSSSSRLSVVEESPRLQSTTTTLVDGSVLLDSPADLGEWNDQTTTTTTGNNIPSLPIPPRMGSLDDWVRTKPVQCSDGQTMGYDSWNSLKAAVQDVNRYSAERYELWHDYFVEVVKLQQAGGTDCTLVNPACRAPHTFDDDSLYYEEEIVMTICPSAKLRKLSRGPIFVNTESMVFECDGCTIRGLGTHMSFGPEAKNVLVRGITFSHATSSSLTFYYDGAEASFEDCHFVNNRARMASWGALADVNSTAVVNFYHCSVTKPWGRRHELSSSLSIRAGP